MKLRLTRRRSLAIGAAVLMLLIWLLWPDRTLARVRALRSELAGDAGKALPADQRDAKVKELRETMQKLTPDQRDALFADGRRRATEEMERYHALSPEEKRKFLDQQIKRQEDMRQRMEQRLQQNGGQRPNGFGGPRGGNRPNTPEERERRRQQTLDRSTPRERDLRDQFRRDMDNRRKQLGLPPSPPGGRR